jgi:hydrogenase-4 component F
VDPAVGPNFTGPILIGMGLFSIATSVVFMLVQRDYKRLFAYSSIEHVGVVLVGFGLSGSVGVFGGLFHMINHSLAKSTAFFASGTVLLRRGTKEIDRVAGLLRQMPPVGAALLLAVLALAGMPPFGLFISEVQIAAGSYADHSLITYSFLGLLIVGFSAMMFQVFRMLFGETEEREMSLSPVPNRFAAVSLIANLAAMGFIGVAPPSFLSDLFITIAAILKSATGAP